MGITFAYSGSVLYAWRKASDRRKQGLPILARSLHLKLTGAMLLVLTFDAFGYLIAVRNVAGHDTALLAMLSDIFVAVALLTIAVGLILPGMIAHSAVEVSKAANELVAGTLRDFTHAMHALAAGDLDAAKAQFNFTPVMVHSRDELGEMAENFNKLQAEIGLAASGLEGARKGLSEARENLEMRVEERTAELSRANQSLIMAHIESEASEHQLRMILESEPEGVTLIAADGTVLEMNPAGLRLFEASQFSEVNAQSMAAMIGSQYREKFLELNAAVFRGESQTLELKVYGLKGTPRWVSIHACPLRDPAGLVTAQLAVMSDITERKKSEQSIEHSLALLRATLESTADGILTVGPHGRIESFNQTFVKTWGIPQDLVASRDDGQVLGFVLEQLLEPEKFLAKVQHLYAHPLEKSFDSLQCKDGREFDRFSRPMLVNGRPAGRVWSFRDVTERKQAEARLEKAHKELMSASRIAGMAEVATSVLHNVGNVLNSVNVSAAMLRKTLGKPHVKNLGLAIGLLRDNTTNLVSFLTQDPRGQRLPAFLGKLSDTLAQEQETQLRELENLGKDIEHIKEIVSLQQNYATAGGITETLGTGELVEEALRMSETSLDKHGIRLVREFQPAPAIVGDRHKVLQILVNLIRNAQEALSASNQPEKTILLSISPVVGNGHVSIKVCDNGVGITDDNLKRIFQHGFTTKKNGHGFGLHSCANAAKEMGGRLRVDNRHDGMGTAFTLELPVAGSLEPEAQVNLHG